MPALRQITAIINTALETGVFSTRAFQSSKFDTLADQVSAMVDDVKITRPVITDNSGEQHDLAIDDIYSLQVYHRNLSLVLEDDQLENFGDEGNTTKETAEMLLICIGDKNRLEVVEQDVASAIWTNVPRILDHATLQTLQIQGCSIESGEVNVKSEEVFLQEYPGVEFNLKQSYFMLSLRYKIVTIFNKKCFQLCS